MYLSATRGMSRPSARGFTLLEWLVVLGIVALLLTLAVPHYFPSVDQARDTILAENLRDTRATIDEFYGDTGSYPDSLEQLVEKKYLRALPVDPITGSNATWIMVSPDNGAKGNVYDIKSGAPGASRSGRPYIDW